jgi:hypothetical protein
MNKKGLIIFFLLVFIMSFASAKFKFFDDLTGNVIETSYHSGDANRDGLINGADVTFLRAYMFTHGPAPNPLLAGDANNDGLIDVSDITHIITILYNNGCTESDEGISYYVEGRIDYLYNNSGASDDGLHVGTDSCIDGQSLKEYACDYYNPSELSPYRQYLCPKGCSDGACILNNNNKYTLSVMSIQATSATIKVIDYA